MANRLRMALFLALLSGGLLATAAASAGPDDRSAAEATLKNVEASTKKAVAAEMTAKAKAALERGANLRASGDEAHARIADALAKTWSDAARDAVKAAELEEKAYDARRAASDAGARADRERALLEEAIAQSGRLRAQLEAHERQSKEQPTRTSTQAADAGVAPKTAPGLPPSVKPASGKDGGVK